jgi:sigma-B regulation protein RsbU (phosphoserine phosphatase)
VSVDPRCGKFSSSLLEESAEELYEGAPCGYLSTSPDGLIIRANATMASWIGYRQDEITGHMRFMDLLTTGGKIFYETHFAPLLRMHGAANEIALDLIGKHGRIIPSLVSAIQKRDAAGVPILNRITLFDTTERRRYERELLLARKRAEETAAELSRLNSELTCSNTALLKANEELGQFAYAASHDLQEPLRTMTTYAQLLARRCEGKLDEDGQLFIRNIVQGSRRMEDLIRDLLSFSQAQGSHLVLRETDMNRPVQIALSNLRSAISESNATVTSDELPSLVVDAARMAQVLQNLIGNAIKYRRPDEAPRIHISCTKAAHEYLFSVQDNGLGFESEYAEQIFGVFKRLHGREIPGTGIGLAICKKMVESHGGRIRAESTVGVGSTFYFSVPIAVRPE